MTTKCNLQLDTQLRGGGGGTKIKDKTGITRKSEQQLYIR